MPIFGKNFLLQIIMTSNLISTNSSFRESWKHVNLKIDLQLIILLKIYFNPHAVVILDVELCQLNILKFACFKAFANIFHNNEFRQNYYITSSALKSDMAFLKNEFFKIFEDLLTLTKITKMAHIYCQTNILKISVIFKLVKCF